MSLSKRNFTTERLPSASHKPPAHFSQCVYPAAFSTLPWILGKQRGRDGTHGGGNGDVSVTW